MEQPIPGSLSEGAGTPNGRDRGSVVRWFLQADGYPQAIIGSETFDRLRSSKYTPSVSHSLDSSLREGAGMGCVPFIVPVGNRKVAGDFHRPYESSDFFTAYVHRSTLPQSRFRSTAPSEREPGWGACHSSCRPETARLRAIFIAPTKTQRWGHSGIQKIVLTKWSIDDRLSIEVDRL